MRFEAIHVRNMGPFVDAQVDLSAIPGRIVAVAGDNGAGKSTLLELLAAGMYRQTPTRGSLTDLATSRDASVEVRLVNGSAYTVRHTVDAVSGKGESVVMGSDGRPLTASAKLRDFDRFAAEHFPTPEVLYASIFAPQGAGGFLELKPGDRKAVLLRVLGIEHLERFADTARERARAAKASLDTACARISDEEARGESLESAEAAVEASRQNVEEARARLDSAQALLATAREEQREVEAATAKREQYDQRLALLSAQLDDLDARHKGLVYRLDKCQAVLGLQPGIDAAVASLPDLDKAIADQSSIVERESAEARSADAAEKLYEEQKTAELARADAAKTKSMALRERADDLEKRLENNRALLERADVIRAAITRDAELAEQIRVHEGAIEMARKDLAAAQRAVQEHERRRLAWSARRMDAEKRRQAAEGRLTDRESVGLAAEDLPRLRELVTTAEAAVADAQSALEELRGQRVSGAEERIVGLRNGLGRVVAESAHADPVQLASIALLRDDEACHLAASLPKALADAHAKVLITQGWLTEDRKALADAERLAARAGEMAQAQAELQAAALADDEAVTGVAEEQAQIDEARKLIDVLGPRIRESTCDAQEERRGLAPLIALADKLTGAEARIAELEPQLAQTLADSATEMVAWKEHEREVVRLRKASCTAGSASCHHAGLADEAGRLVDAIRAERDKSSQLAARAVELAAAQASLAELYPQLERNRSAWAELSQQLESLEEPVLPPRPNLPAAELAAEHAEGTLRKAYGSSAQAQARVDAAKVRAAKLAELADSRTAVETDVSDWVRLSQDLGRDGLQAMEIDAAGPELTELINDLLRACVGSRWTVSVETQRASADGKKTIEGCEIRVLDTERGRDATADSLSGGERVLVGEAISLALSMLACRRSGLEGITLVRDETGAALDPTNGRAYVAMLRRAAVIVGASQVLFVSHSPEVQELADARIWVSGGKVSVQA